MKKLFLASLAVLSILACPIVGSAQANSYDVTIAYDKPMTDLSDAVNTGFGVGGDVFWSLPSMPELQIGGRLADNYFFGTKSTFNFFKITTKTTFNALEVMPSVRYSLPTTGNWTFFGQVGLGMFFQKASIKVTSIAGTQNATNSDSNIGVTLAGGGIFQIEGQQLIIMPLYSFVKDTHYLGLNVGLKLK